MGCRRAGGGVGCKDDSGKLGWRGWCCQILQPRRKGEEQDCREEAEAEALCSTLWNGQKKTESSQRRCAGHTLGAGLGAFLVNSLHLALLVLGRKTEAQDGIVPRQ